MKHHYTLSTDFVIPGKALLISFTCATESLAQKCADHWCKQRQAYGLLFVTDDQNRIEVISEHGQEFLVIT